MIADEYWLSSAFGFDVIAVRIFVAALLGAVLGFVHELRSRDAGIKTHMILSTAAATFALVTLEIYAHARLHSGANADPIRIIEAVTAGVAFIAAGTILRGTEKVRGLTTGAGMWLAGAVGLAAGTGHFALAIIATVTGLVVFTIIRWIERLSFPKDE